jgi:hypothetical protein
MRSRKTNQVLAANNAPRASLTQLYLTHPNKRYSIGDEVMNIDTIEVPFIGHVLGHIAEDRLLVEWPTHIAQETYDEIMPVRESVWGRSKVASQTPNGSFKGKMERLAKESVFLTNKLTVASRIRKIARIANPTSKWKSKFIASSGLKIADDLSKIKGGESLSQELIETIAEILQ